MKSKKKIDPRKASWTETKTGIRCDAFNSNLVRLSSKTLRALRAKKSAIRKKLSEVRRRRLYMEAVNKAAKDRARR